MLTQVYAHSIPEIYAQSIPNFMLTTPRIYAHQKPFMLSERILLLATIPIFMLTRKQCMLRRAKEAPRRPQDGSKGRSKRPQEGPSRAPGEAQDVALGAPQEGQESLRRATGGRQEGARRAPGGRHWRGVCTESHASSASAEMRRKR